MARKSLRIDEATVVYKEKPELADPILIEGLPGVGNVGKLAAEHLIDEIKAKKFAEIYSTDFPPQVFIDNDGIIHLVKNELYYWKGDVDLIILTGDYQGLSTRGQYILTQAILDVVEKYGTKMIYTLGGYGVGVEVEKPRVTGAATHKTLTKKLKKYDILFKDEGGGGIVGASGLLLGIGCSTALCSAGKSEHQIISVDYQSRAYEYVAIRIKRVRNSDMQTYKANSEPSLSSQHPSYVADGVSAVPHIICSKFCYCDAEIVFE